MDYVCWMIPQVGIRWSILPFKNFAPVRAPLRILGDCHLAVSSGQQPLLSLDRPCDAACHGWCSVNQGGRSVSQTHHGCTKLTTPCGATKKAPKSAKFRVWDKAAKGMEVPLVLEMPKSPYNMTLDSPRVSSLLKTSFVLPAISVQYYCVTWSQLCITQ